MGLHPDPKLGKGLKKTQERDRQKELIIKAVCSTESYNVLKGFLIDITKFISTFSHLFFLQEKMNLRNLGFVATGK